jgi:GNAT superfamily N-acetyltransferase/predicted transcriptional regulator
MALSQDALTVFVSSVQGAEDLQAERDAAIKAIREITLTTPWAFEYADAEPEPAERVYLREAAESDLLVLIVSNSHSVAVQAELETAEQHRRPVIAFVKRLDDGVAEATGRQSVLAWLRRRVKYRLFSDLADLETAVSSSVASEIVRGYRNFRERLSRDDVDTLLARVPAEPSLIVHTADEGDRLELEQILLELEPWYPEIRGWIPSALGDVQAGEVRIAQIGDETAAIAIARQKDARVRKFSTVYVRDAHRGESVGPHLVHDEVKRAGNDGISKAYVTFADELFDVLGPMFRRYGFVPEGVAPGRYRPQVAEWVMGKTFVYDRVGPDQFPDFVLRQLVTAVGGRIVHRRGHVAVCRIPREPLLGIGGSQADQWLVTCTSPVPEETYASCRERLATKSWTFVSLYGRPADASHWSHRTTNWIDGEDLRRRYYPVEFIVTEETSILCTIRQQYANALIPRIDAPQLFAPDRLQIRPDNVFYRAPVQYRDLRRGSRIFFYVSSPEKSLRGSARISELKISDPESCLSSYGEMGILQFRDLAEISARHQGNVLAISFDWYQQHPVRLAFKNIKDTLGAYNPVGAKTLTFEEQTKLLAESGVEWPQPR